MIEIWRDVEGYDGLYQVSNFGRVKSFKYKTPRIMKLSFNSRGYLHVDLCRDGKVKRFRVHRLVAAAFIPNPENKPTVNHINGIKTDNRVENLEWVTHAENTQHALTTGLMTQGEECYNAKFTNEQVRYIRDNPDGLNCAELAQRFGITPTLIGYIQCGKHYRNVGGRIRTTRLPNPRRVPDEIREQIRREYKPSVRGYGCRALARKYGVSQRTILNIVHEN